MEKSIQNNLCKALRGCGVPKRETLEMVNTISRWYDSCGAQWTVNRLSELKQWYESILAGSPSPPSWFAHTSTGYPKGIFAKVFAYKNPAKVLAVLSAGTIFKSNEITSHQREKFLTALDAGELEHAPDLDKWPTGKQVRLPNLREQILPPGFDCITGNSIPISESQGKIFITPRFSPRNRSDRKRFDRELERNKVIAYCDSWANVPLPTLEYLSREGMLDQVPPALIDEDGWDGLFAVLPEQRIHAGFIGCIQEPALKARWIANPNRVTQHYLGPLGRHWYNILRSIPTDCTFNQEMGIQWVQDKLSKGVCLSGADLSSATDLLDRQSCLRMITKVYLGRNWDNSQDWSLPVETSYRRAVDHFMDISSMGWVYPEGGTVSWSRGQPLGTYPSFAMLGLTNNAFGREACRRSGIPLDSFRVIGDDIIMDSRALNEYILLVRSFGGLINHQKTLTSSQCAEFAGRVILPNRSVQKTVKYKAMGDNSFMDIVSNLGDQAKSLLRPRQRHQYELFKYVPGYVVEGPYPKNSFGIPLLMRYSWYLMKSGLSKDRVIPDKEKLDSWQFGQKIYYTLSELGRLGDFELSCPFTFSDDFQSSLATAVAKSGDPRLQDGKTCLEALEAISSSRGFESFEKWIAGEQAKSIRTFSDSEEWSYDHDLEEDESLLL